MYLNFYGLKKEPFHITPDPFFFYLGPTHREAFAALIYAIRNKKGFVAITGEVGLGKTTVVRTFLQQYKTQENLKILFIFNTKLSFKNLLKLILVELGIDKDKIQSMEYNAKESEDFEFEAIQLLYDSLIEEYKKGINVVLILDEAQNLPVSTLEKLRLISNLETEKNKLIQIFLIGQPELDTKLSLRNLRQLKQRIELRVKLKPFKKKDVEKYINFRLKKAGYFGTGIFTNSAIKKITRYSNGIPRKINVICDNALIHGFSQDKKKISGKIIKEVCRELYEDKDKVKLKNIIYLSLFFIVFGISFYVGTHISDISFLFFPKQNVASTHNIKIKNNYNTEKTNKYAATQLLNPFSNNTQSIKKLKKSIKREINPSNNATLRTTKNSSNSSLIINNSIPLKISPQPPKYNLKKTILSENELLEKMDTNEKIIYLILDEKLPFFKKLSTVRQMVLIEMAKQTSISGLMTFEKMLAALKKNNFEAASRHMLYSSWYQRVGEPALELAKIMKTNDKKLLIEWMSKYDKKHIK